LAEIPESLPALYLCGPPVMLKATIAMLEALGVDQGVHRI